jgi:hypothetical protein
LDFGGRPDPIRLLGSATPRTRRRGKRKQYLFSLGNATDGYIQLKELSGIGGKESESLPRLLATFHGKFHPPDRKKNRNDITFEILNPSGSSAGIHGGDVRGFDPECIMGIDAFVLTFVNREFVIYLPFLLDTRKQISHLQVRAEAYSQNKKVGESPILNLPIHRNHTVETTTEIKNRRGKVTGYYRYRGRVIGNRILHHKDFIIDTPSPIIQISSKMPANTFKRYEEGKLQIVLMNDFLNGLTPHPSKTNYLISMPNPLTVGQWESKLQTQMKKSLKEIFLDAGFTGMKVFTQNDNAARQLVTEFRDARYRNRDIEADFWTFYITRDDSIPVLGYSESLRKSFNIMIGGKRQSSPYQKPIGDGNKKIVVPIRINTATLTSWLPAAVVINDVYGGDSDKVIEVQCKRTAILVAHEIGHSLGLMHEMIIPERMNNPKRVPYSEDGAKYLLTIMCSGGDKDKYSLDAKFSNQAKAIWMKAFKVHPKDFSETYFKNKTWSKNEVKSLSWIDRRKRIYKKHYEDGMTYMPLGSSRKVPLYAGRGAKAQRGTYRK